MAWVAVDEDELIFENEPFRMDGMWYPKFFEKGKDISRIGVDTFSFFVKLPDGSIEKLIGKKLTWNDEPVELM